MSTDAWPRSARLDAPAVIERIAAITGVRLVLEGPCPGGAGGAAYVRWPDGRRSVLTGGHASTGPLLDLARAAGVPTARYELSARVDGARIVVQQRLPGTPPVIVDAALVHRMLALNDRLAGLLTGRWDVPAVELYLITDGPGFCLHQPLKSYGPRTARLLDWVHEVGATYVEDDEGEDLVHLGYHPGNLLVSGDRITGVIDWDRARRGDRRLDLVTLRFELARRFPGLTGPVDERLAAVDAERLRAYWAHVSLRLVDWAIRHHDPAAVDGWLAVAEHGLRR